MSGETIILDPTEESPGRSQLDISTGPNIVVSEDGIDWDVASIEAFSADQVRGSVPIGYRVPNRTITMRLIIKTATGGVTFDQARRKLQSKVSRIQQEGGVLKRVLPNGGVLYADLVDASLQLPGSSYQAYKGFEPEATLTLVALPDFYGPEVLGSVVTETTKPELTTVITGIPGDFPARCRIIVNEDQGTNQKGVLWSIRSRHYTADATAAIVNEAQSYTLLGGAAVVSDANAYGGSMVQWGSYTNTNWTPIIGLDALTHEGNYRVFARASSFVWGNLVSLRLIWGVGDLRNPTRNAPFVFPGPDSYYMADLGMVRLKPPPVGTHKWYGQLQVRGPLAKVDRLYFVNVDDGMGIARASVDTDAAGVETAVDNFNQAAGAATGKTLDVGGTWGGAGDADDFQIAAGVATRSVSGDTSLWGGRLLTASGSAATAQTVRVDFKHAVAPADDVGGTELRFTQAVIARYVDASNYIIGGLMSRTYWSLFGQYFVAKRVAGTASFVYAGSDSTFFGPIDYWWRATLQVDADGNWAFNLSPQASHVDEFTVTGQDAVFATGGALASGKAGIFDANNSSTTGVRTYDNFDVVGYNTDSAVYASQSAQLTSEGAFREDSTGVAYKRLAAYQGDYPRLPPATTDNRAAELLVKMSRGDFDQIPDTGIDNLSVQVAYRPAWLITPIDP